MVVCFSASGGDKCDGIVAKLVSLAQQYVNCVFLEVDSEVTDVGDALDVTDYPTFHFYRDSERVCIHF